MRSSLTPICEPSLVDQTYITSPSKQKYLYLSIDYMLVLKLLSLSRPFLVLAVLIKFTIFFGDSMKKFVMSASLVLTSAMFATSASADLLTLSATDIYNGNTGFLNFSANGGDNSFALKTSGAVTGVGVATDSNPVKSEIDIDESISASYADGFKLLSTKLSFLFDGPEYGDVQETAYITGTYKVGGEHFAKAVNLFVNPTDNAVNLYIDGVLSNSCHLEFRRFVW
jgi:hypothetical protein